MFKYLKAATVSAFCLLSIFSQPLMAGEPPAHIMALLNDRTPLKPTKVFDNFYSIGNKSVTAWVLNTSEGMILIDSMWDDNDAKTIIKGMEELGLDPTQLKYILISHGHGDHYGGANYLRNKYHAKVVFSKEDKELMMTLNTGPNAPTSPKTPVDMFVKDGDVFTLGDRSIKILSTPGHTPGGISFIFPVTNEGEKHTAVLWGGTGIPDDMKSQLAYKNSVEYFIKEAKKAGADIELTAHLFIGDNFAKLEAAGKRKKGEKNPFILSSDEMNNYYDELQKSIDTAIEANK